MSYTQQHTEDYSYKFQTGTKIEKREKIMHGAV